MPWPSFKCDSWTTCFRVLGRAYKNDSWAHLKSTSPAWILCMLKFENNAINNVPKVILLASIMAPKDIHILIQESMTMLPYMTKGTVQVMGPDTGSITWIIQSANLITRVLEMEKQSQLHAEMHHVKNLIYQCWLEGGGHEPRIWAALEAGNDPQVQPARNENLVLHHKDGILPRTWMSSKGVSFEVSKKKTLLTLCETPSDF